jgi:hypothetical protein
MLNDRNTVQDLLDKRNELEVERHAIDTEFERIKTKKQGVDGRVNALDLVISMFSGEEGSQPKQTQQVNRVTPVTDSSVQVEWIEPIFQLDAAGGSISLRQLVPDNVDKLPQQFTKHNVAGLIMNLRPEITEVNDNTLSGIMRRLVSLGFSRISVAGSGKRAQVYEKITR